MRRHPIPVVVAFIYQERPFAVLLHRKDESHDEHGVARNPELVGKLELPGGMIEGAESPKDALRREMREELKLEINIHRLAEIKSFVFKDDKPYLVIYYICSAAGTHHGPPPNCHYFSIKELKRLQESECIPGELEVIRKLASGFMRLGEDHETDPTGLYPWR